MKNNLSIATAAIIALALASVQILTPSTVLAAKTTPSGGHIQGPPPTISGIGTSSASSTSFQIAGLGQGSGTAVLTAIGFFDVRCSNPGHNTDVPGQRTSATGSSAPQSFSTDKFGKATVNPLTVQLTPPSSFPAGTCPNSQWTASAVGQGTITSATLTVTFNGATIFTKTAP